MDLTLPLDKRAHSRHQPKTSSSSTASRPGDGRKQEVNPQRSSMLLCVVLYGHSPADSAFSYRLFTASINVDNATQPPATRQRCFQHRQPECPSGSPRQQLFSLKASRSSSCTFRKPDVCSNRAAVQYTSQPAHRTGDTRKTTV